MQHISYRVYHLAKRLLSRLDMIIRAIKSEIDWRYSWIRTLKFFRKPRKSMKVYNTYFDSAELSQLPHEISELMHADRYLYYRLSQKEIQGIRGWEYGKLLNYFKGDFTDLQILDIGPGNSTFPAFLARKGGLVTTIDYPMPLEYMILGHRQKMQRGGVSLTHGTMLRLPYPNDVFNLVTCISTIEHLDVDPDTMRPIPYDQFLRLSKAALVEMARVTEPGGFIYLTTETYEPKLQLDDNWYTEIPYQGVGAAYHLVDIEEFFAKTLRQAECHFVGPVELEPDLLLNNACRSNFRGRYITTFCIFVQKGLALDNRSQPG